MCKSEHPQTAGEEIDSSDNKGLHEAPALRPFSGPVDPGAELAPAMNVVTPLLTPEAIRDRVQQLGRQISAETEGSPLAVACVLRGASIFAADLLRAITLPASLDFLAISSYGRRSRSSGVVRITKDLDDPIEGRHVLLVEDIVDSGLTLQYLLRHLQARSPASLRTAVLLDKPDRRVAPVHADYVGFTIPDEFVVGYGLDYAQQFRGLPYVGTINPDDAPP